MNRPRVPHWLLATAVFVAGALVAWWMVRSTPRPVLLPDGSEVTLLTTTHGVDHSLTMGSFWLKAARRWLSPARARELGLREFRHHVDRPALVVWTYWRFPATNEFRMFASLQDRHGVESEPASPAVFAPTPGRREALVAWQFKNFPSRQEEVTLRFHERDVFYRPRCLGGMTVPNPRRGPSPTWATSVAPVSVRQDGIEFILLNWECGGAPTKSLLPTGGAVAPWNRIYFEIRTNGMVDCAWRARRIEGLGATGNSFSFSLPSARRPSDPMVAEFASPIWPDEPGWKLTVEFSRTDHFGSDETWVVRGVPIPRAGSITRSNLSLTAHNVTLTNLQVGELPPMQIRPGHDSPNVEARLEFTASTGRHIDFYKAVDDRGRELSRDDGISLSGNSYAARFHAHADSKSVDLIFAVHPIRLVEFLARPSFQTNLSSVPPADLKPVGNASR